MDKIIEINSAVNGFVWGPIMLALLVGTGIYLSFRVGFIQFSKIGYWWKNTIGKIFQKSEAGEGEITPMQAVSTALASTVGTGNIAGVTGAIILGGPGAVFWMWISALFGMVTKFAEVTLAVKYRERNEKGDWCGGPMYYIKNGLGPKWKWLGVIFSVFGALAAFGIGNISQINSIASSVNSVAVAFHENAKEFDTIIGLITGVVIAIFVALVLLGGVKRIGQVTEKLVPGMAAIYIVCALVVVIANAGTIPGVFASIFQGAFNPSAVVGGAVGVTMKLAITKGVGRGVFSNEAGLGSAPPVVDINRGWYFDFDLLPFVGCGGGELGRYAGPRAPVGRDVDALQLPAAVEAYFVAQRFFLRGDETFGRREVVVENCFFGFDADAGAYCGDKQHNQSCLTWHQSVIAKMNVMNVFKKSF